MGGSATSGKVELVEELRQFKGLCDRLLPGLRTQSHLYTLIHLCDSARCHTTSDRSSTALARRPIDVVASHAAPLVPPRVPPQKRIR